VLIGYTVDRSGPDGPVNSILNLGPIVVAAVAVSAALTSVSMASSFLTDRRAFASIVIVLVMFASPALADALIEGGDLSPYWRVIDLLSMPLELVARIYGEPGEFPELSTLVVLLANVVWTVAGLAIVAWRYSRLVIAR
jgi:ABC-2 type transport system permease protein